MTKILLSNFTDVLSEKILKRGKDYYRKGHVQEFEERDEEEFAAIVEGTEAYDVRISLDGNTVTKHTCDCPYDMGEYCKHEVALLYAISQYKQQVADGVWAGELDPQQAERPQGFTKKKSGSRKKQKTIATQIQETLDHLSHDQLKQIVATQAKSDRAFRAFVLRHALIDPNIDLKDAYKKQIKDCIRAAAGRDGYVGYWEAQHAIVAADELLYKAEELLQQKQLEMVWQILQAVLEVLQPALNNVDDSNGEFGGAIEYAWELFGRLIVQVTPRLASEIFHYCLREAPNKQYQGWGWEWSYLSTAADLVETDKQEQQIYQALDAVLKSKKKHKSDRHGINPRTMERITVPAINDWDLKSALNIKTSVLQKRGKQEDIQKLNEENMHIPEIRKQKIEHVIKERDYKEAKKLAKEGIKIAKGQGHLGTIHDFEEVLVDIARKEKDVDTERKYLKQWFLNRTDMSLYRDLKKTYNNTDEWRAVSDDLLKEISNKRWGGSVHDALNILQEEERWNEFLATMQKACSEARGYSFEHAENIRLLEQYESTMKEHFHDQLIQLYTQAVKQSLCNAAGRKHYRYICRILRRMRKQGGQVAVDEIEQHIKAQYGNRKALLDELSRV